MRYLISTMQGPLKSFASFVAGYGNFTFKLDFYDSSSFSTPYTQKDYPLDMPLNDYMYLGYSVESSADLVVMAVNCKATKDGSFYSLPQYTIIDNGWVHSYHYTHRRPDVV